MSTTTAPVVRAQLISLLATRPAITAVNPATGMPVLVAHVWQGQADKQEHIYLGNTSADLEFATIRSGRKKREEDYTVDIVIDVEIPTDWGPSSETRAFALAAEVDDMLADDPAIGLAATIPTLRMHVSHIEQSSGALDPGGIGTRIVLTISVQSRLT